MSAVLTYWSARWAEWEPDRARGAGSRRRLARHKASSVNAALKAVGVRSVVELGCGDGLIGARLDCDQYLGLDPSPAAVAGARARFKGDRRRRAEVYDPFTFTTIVADAALSMDVVFHLVEDTLYKLHLLHLFASATRTVLLYTTDRPREQIAEHVVHRPVSADVATWFPRWVLRDRVPARYGTARFGERGSDCELLVYVPEVLR